METSQYAGSHIAYDVVVDLDVNDADHPSHVVLPIIPLATA